MEFKIGPLIESVLADRNMDKVTFARLLNKSYPTALTILKTNKVRTDDLMQICQILQYDFFRVLSGELKKACPQAGRNMLYGNNTRGEMRNDPRIPHYKKHLYTDEFIETVLGEIADKKISKYDALRKYQIPKTTLYRWCRERNI